LSIVPRTDLSPGHGKGNLSFAQILHRRIEGLRSISKNDLSKAQIALAMTGREIGPGHNRQTWPNSSTAPSLRSVDLPADGEYHDINFALAAVKLPRLAGLMGRDATRSLRGFFGLPPADLGTIEIDGRPIGIRNVSDAVRAGLAYVPEDRLSEGLFLDFSIGDNIVVRAMDRLISKTGWISVRARPKKPPTGLTGCRLRRLQLVCQSVVFPGEPAAGRSCQMDCRHPRLLILNRPTTGIDIGSKQGIHQIITELPRKRSAHFGVRRSAELMLICDRVIVMRAGAIVAKEMSVRVRNRKSRRS